MGVHRATACVIGDEEAVHQARRTARAGVHRTRGIGRRAACGGPIGQEEQLCCPPIGQARTHHTLFFLPNGHMLFFVSTDPPPAVLPARWTQHTPCLTGPPQAVLVCSTDRWTTARCSKKNMCWVPSDQEQFVLGSIGEEERHVLGPPRKRSTNKECGGSIRQEEQVWGPSRSPGGEESEEKFGEAERGDRADEGLQLIVWNGAWAQNLLWRQQCTKLSRQNCMLRE